MFGRKQRVYTDKQLVFLEELRNPENLGDLRACMHAAGYAKTAPVGEIIKSLKDEIIEIAKEILGATAVEASLVITKAIRDVDPNTMVKTQNAERILDRVGIVKGEKIMVDTAPNRIAIIPRRNKD